MRTTVTPGMHPNASLDHFTEEEKRIILTLSQEWYVTNTGGTISLGSTSQYKYFLVKPTEIYREMFNLDRELIVLFSPYERFEPRTLDAIEAAASKYQSLRIERICSIVISKDIAIVDKLRSLLKNGSESQVVVPFSYNELLTNFDTYFMRNRFKSDFYMRDLFAFEAPLRKEYYFFGRTDIIHKIANRHKSCENSGLFGLRKSGKTSVIYGIVRSLSRSEGRTVVIDCESPAFHQRRWTSALYYIVSEIKSQNNVKHNLEPEEKYTPENATIIFEREIKALYQKAGKKSILIIFDEIENITFKVSPSPHWSEGTDFIYFWQSMRSVFQKLQSTFSYLIVGTNAMCIETPVINGKDNPIFNQAQVEYMPRFDVPQTHEMVSKLSIYMGLNFDEVVYGLLNEDFGGHPYLIRHVCSVINQTSASEKPVRIHKASYARAKAIFNKQNVSYIEMILQVLKQYYPDEYSMMEYLAFGDTEAFLDLANTSSEYTNHLLGYGIIDRDGDDFIFRIDSVREYLVAKNRYKKIKLTQAEMTAEISERRNNLEPKIRMIIRNQMRATFGKPEATERVLSVLGPSIRSAAASLAYEDLFNPNLINIYFDDLRKIILKNWDIFKNIFTKDKDSFDDKMQNINKGRIDAHAKEISDDEFSHLRASLSFVEGQINEFSQ